MTSPSNFWASRIIHLSSSICSSNLVFSALSKSFKLPRMNLKVFLILLYWSDTLLRISSDATISLLKSVEATHSRKMSAPKLSQTFWGDTTLPRDLDCFLPFSSTTKPWVRTALYGALPFIAMLVSNDDWNHPLCWSEPSKYRSATTPLENLFSETVEWVTPESNQTSKVSRVFIYFEASSI